jgi:peptide deformylase
MFHDLRIIHWPDPRLKKVSRPVEVFDESLRALAARMLELMREARGIGLAAPQVGLDLRVFVMNPTGDLKDDRIYANPVLSDLEGQEEAEEGCLSIPDLHVNIVRATSARLTAQDQYGSPIEEQASDLVARIWQHETDHLDGTLLLDRMGPVAKLTNRRLLKDLEEKYAAATKRSALSARPLRARR